MPYFGMANNPQISHAAANAAVNSITALLNGGTLLLYTGTQPAGPDTAVSGQTLLATLTFSATAFGNAVNGVATANAITAGTAGNTGTATWARMLSSGSVAEVDCSVGTSGADLNLSTTSIVSGASVSVTSLTLTLPNN